MRVLLLIISPSLLPTVRKRRRWSLQTRRSSLMPSTNSRYFYIFIVTFLAVFPISKDYDNVDRYFLELHNRIDIDHTMGISWNCRLVWRRLTLMTTLSLRLCTGRLVIIVMLQFMCSCVMMVFVVKIMTTLSLRLSTGRFVIIAMIVFMCSCIINLKS